MAKSQRKGPKPKLQDNGSLADLIEEGPITNPIDLIHNASLNIEDDDAIDEKYNKIDGDLEAVEASEDMRQEFLGPGVTQAPKRPTIQKKVIPHFEEDLPDREIIEKVLPKIRKVVIRKISRYNFRLGMERAKDKPKLVPGVGHRFVCDMKGNEYITGFDSGKYDQERTRLEKIMRVDLGPTSKFWGTLTYRLEDKEHGQIMNFDDPQFGPTNEVVYFAMLGSSIIANGYHEYQSGKKPYAEWYIEDKEAEAEVEQSNITMDLEAAQVYQDMSVIKRRGIAKLLGLPVWGGSDKIVNTELFKFIRKDEKNGEATRPGENAREFLALARKSDTELNVRVLVTDAIQINVLRKNKHGEYFIADVQLGATPDSIVAKLILPQYSEVREAIYNQLRKRNPNI